MEKIKNNNAEFKAAKKNEGFRLEDYIVSDSERNDAPPVHFAANSVSRENDLDMLLRSLQEIRTSLDALNSRLDKIMYLI